MKLTDTTKPIDRTFTLELNSRELSILAILVGGSSRSSFEDSMRVCDVPWGNTQAIIEEYNNNSDYLYSALIKPFLEGR